MRLVSWYNLLIGISPYHVLLCLPCLSSLGTAWMPSPHWPLRWHWWTAAPSWILTWLNMVTCFWRPGSKPRRFSRSKFSSPTGQLKNAKGPRAGRIWIMGLFKKYPNNSWHSISPIELPLLGASIGPQTSPQTRPESVWISRWKRANHCMVAPRAAKMGACFRGVTVGIVWYSLMPFKRCIFKCVFSSLFRTTFGRWTR